MIAYPVYRYFAARTSGFRSPSRSPPSESAPVTCGRSLWSSRTLASPSPADIRHGNQVVALGPMLSTVRSVYLFWNKFAFGRVAIAHTVSDTLRESRMVKAPDYWQAGTID
jgi:hypothetical protein